MMDLDMLITDLPFYKTLSPLCKRALQLNNIVRLRDLAGKTSTEFLRIPGVGEWTAKEVCGIWWRAGYSVTVSYDDYFSSLEMHYDGTK